MAKIYYYKNSQQGFSELTLKDINAAPQDHSHWSSAFGIINQSQGGIQNNTDINLKQYTGPLLYKNNNELDNRYINNNGVYYFQNTEEDYVHIGMPGWEQGAIPYSTEEEQLENTLKKIPIGASLFYPILIASGALSANGRNFYVILKSNYILPEKADISLSGWYVIRQNGAYLFTSSDPENNATWNYKGNFPIQFKNVPSGLSTNQKIINSDTEGWRVHYTGITNENIVHKNIYSGQLRLGIASETPQTTTYSYQSNTATAPTNYVGAGYISGTVIFTDLKLTFNPPATVTP